MPSPAAKKRPARLIDLMQLNEGYQRSVELEHDFQSAGSTKNFVATDFVQSVASRIYAAFEEGSTQRAWRITGDYGSGKSAFALSLLKATCGREKEIPASLRIEKHKALTPVIAIGEREPLVHTIGKALIGQAPGLSRSELPKNNEELISLVKKALKGSEGIVLILDEMGKNLEYATSDPDSADVYILQKLAEMASRSGAKPLVMVAILHRGISSYISDLDSNARREWDKVAGRFDEITFQHPFEQTVHLCANALNVRTEKLPEKLKADSRRAMKWCIATGAFGYVAEKTLLGFAPQLYPLHPTVLIPLDRLFKRFGQNERSLFGFLTGFEPFAIREKAGCAVERADFYGLPDLYDYLKANVAPALTNGKATHWRVIESVTQQGESLKEIQILKTVGILNLLDDDSSIATTEFVAHSINENTPNGLKSVSTIIDNLVSRHLLFKRGIKRGYALWPHTSVHLDDEFAKAKANALNSSEPMRTVSSLLETRQVVARRHYIETGGLRHFEQQFLPACDFELFASSGPTAIQGECDGFVVVFFPKSQREYKSTYKALSEHKKSFSPDVLIALSRPPSNLLGIAEDVQAWRHVSKNVPELASDHYARAEVNKQLLAAENKLEESVSRFVGLDGENSNLTWFQNGDESSENKQNLSGRLSDLCDNLYPKSPKIVNELINRRISSSAGSRARTALIDLISKNPSQPFLGLDQDKNPPEMSIYLSILKAGHIHVEDSENPGSWKIQFPQTKAKDTNRLRPSFDAIQKHLKKNEGRRVRVDELIAILKEAPIGAREGVIPLILSIYLAATSDVTAVYEDRTYIHAVGAEEIQRMAKEPEFFDFQHCAVEGVRLEIFEAVAEVFKLQEKTNPVVLDVVRPLMDFISRVPEYSRNTKKLEPQSVQLRQKLLTARDPSALIFEDIPAITGKKGKAVAVELARLIRDIQQSYDRLLDRLAQSIQDAFDSTAPIDELRTELQGRSQAMSKNLSESDLRAFVLRVGDKQLAYSNWLESLANHLSKKTPRRWNDADESVFHTKVGAMAKRMLRAEAALDDIFKKGLSKEKDRTVRLALTKPNGDEHVELLHWSKSEERKVGELEKTISDLITKNGRAGLGAAAKALWNHLED